MAENKPPEDTQKYIEQMREWLNSQPHLPKDIDDILLLRFVHSCYYDLEKAKTAADLFFTLRSSIPELLSNRDPLSPQMQKYFSMVNLAHLKISGNRNLWVWQLNDPGLENYDYAQDAKMFLLSTDAWFLTNTEFEEADIVLMDAKDISLKFVTKFNVSIARKISKYQEDAMPIRLKQIHIINAPSIIDKVFGLMKPFLKKEITEMIHFHPTSKADGISKYLEKDDLPEDFGGTRGKMKDHMKNVLDVILKNREKLISDNLWTATEKKSKNKKEKESSAEVTFRTLAID